MAFSRWPPGPKISAIAGRASPAWAAAADAPVPARPWRFTAAVENATGACRASARSLGAGGTGFGFWDYLGMGITPRWAPSLRSGEPAYLNTRPGLPRNATDQHRVGGSRENNTASAAHCCACNLHATFAREAPQHSIRVDHRPHTSRPVTVR